MASRVLFCLSPRLATPVLASPPTHGAGDAAQGTAVPAPATPQEALPRLRDGNDRFLRGAPAEWDVGDVIAITAQGQSPFGIVLGCRDSRVPPELVFAQATGDIFTARIAGNFEDTDILGSIEYGAEVVGASVIVVLGHTSCGAVKGACDLVVMGNLTQMSSNVAPAVYAPRSQPGADRSSKNREFVEAVAETNVRQTVNNVVERSPILRARVEGGELLVIGAIYDGATAEVRFLDDTLLGTVGTPARGHAAAQPPPARPARAER